MYEVNKMRGGFIVSGDSLSRTPALGAGSGVVAPSLSLRER